MSGSCQVSLPVVRELSVGLPGTLGGQPGASRMVMTPSWLSGNGRVALPDVREWSGDPAECPGVVRGPPGCPGGLADVREWSECHLRCLEIVR